MSELFEKPWRVTDVKDCNFYHTIELPELGTMYGVWDLREGIDAYLSPAQFEGKRVLEIGTANGFLCFELEKRGAEVIAFDLADDLSYDIIPIHGANIEVLAAQQREDLRKTKNAFWLTHRLLNSRSKVLYGHANYIPMEIGTVDIAFFGNVLQHLKDPFGAIITASKLADQIIVTEATWKHQLVQDEAWMFFLPAPKEDEDPHKWCFSWWQATPGVVKKWLEVLGYEILGSSVHRQFFRRESRYVDHFTVSAFKK